MRLHSKYHFKGVGKTLCADPEGVMTVLYEFDSKDEVIANGILNDPRRTTSFANRGKFYVGGHFDMAVAM